jgi:hypothetical protein
MPALFAQGISRTQDARNNIYLERLDENLIDTIKMLETFSDRAQNVEHFDMVDAYTSFLMNMTMECAKLRNYISQAENATSAEEREDIIAILIFTLKPELEEFDEDVTRAQDRENQDYLEDISERIKKTRGNTLQSLIKEEEKMVQTGMISTEYMELHARFFFLNLLDDFVKPYTFLSRQNRALLTEIVKDIDKNMPAL